MALIIMNEDKGYITRSQSGAVIRTLDIEQAEDFVTLEKAIEFCRYAPSKTRGYYVYDTVTKKICFRTSEKKKINRKQYSQSTRLLIYNNADGRCELCGRKILLDDMTLDHIKPLSMGGVDKVENLACTCKPCNLFKRNMLPDAFHERIALIYLYQMENILLVLI